MQMLYVVNLDLDGPDAFERARRHVAEWLSDVDHPLDETFLTEGGMRPLAPGRAGDRLIPRQGECEVITDAARGFLIRVRQADEQSGLTLTTRITVVEQEGRTRFRVGIGRAASGEALVPVSATTVFQPRIVRLLDQDDEVRLTVGGQHVEGRYIQIKTVGEASALAEALPLESRLPTLLIHVRSPEAWDLARRTSQRLLGLANTVTLNYATSRAVTAAHPEVSVPFGGLALVWPRLGASAFSMTAEQIRDQGPSDVLRYLAQRLGSVAALVNGRDRVWEAARAASDDARLRQLVRRAEDARDQQDTSAEIEALREQLSLLEASNRDLAEIGEDAMQRADDADDRLKSADVEMERLRKESVAWREAYEAVVTTSTPDVAQDPWAAIPTLACGKDPAATFDALTDAASDHIVFTDRAGETWKASPYPFPEDMTEKLTQLARAAADLYGTDRASMPHMDEWFRTEHDLTVAMTDKTITEFRKKKMRWLHSFEFDGAKNLNATPHVKVRDAVAPNECGRIHFALEGSKQRIVVHSVSVKTYTL